MNKNTKITMNNKGQHGYWELYHTDNSLMYKGFFVNGKNVGYSEYYRRIDNVELLFNI